PMALAAREPYPPGVKICFSKTSRLRVGSNHNANFKTIDFRGSPSLLLYTHPIYNRQRRLALEGFLAEPRPCRTRSIPRALNRQRRHIENRIHFARKQCKSARNRSYKAGQNHAWNATG